MIINLVVEGQSDLGAARAIVRFAGHEVGTEVDKRGKNNLDPDIPKYNQAARREPWVVFRDTDSKCPVTLREELLGAMTPSVGFLLRLAHSMTESWLLADRQGFSTYFRVAEASIPLDPDQLPHAKRTLLNLCERSRSRLIRSAMVRGDGEVGPLYVTTVNDFATNSWSVDRAVEHSDSLRRAVDRIRELDPSVVIA